MKSCLKLSNGTFETRREAVSKMYTGKAALAKQSLECKSGGIRLFFPPRSVCPVCLHSLAAQRSMERGEAPAQVGPIDATSGSAAIQKNSLQQKMEPSKLALHKEVDLDANFKP